jgi:pyrroloquinoline quinone (PQQ) biosynthesis protein C
MMSLKNYVFSENKAVVRNDPVILALLGKTLNRTQYRLYAAQRAYVATNFIRLVDKAAKLARELGDEELAAALQSNLHDEIGMGPDGNRYDALDHRKWKATYLRALGIEADVQGFPLLQATRAHMNSFLEIEADGTVFSISGAILSLENIIPLEYRSAVSSRDHLFPEIFCPTDNDSMDVREKKELARQYMDDHIIHDSKSHFPQLLQALVKYESDPVAMTEIRAGIDLVNTYRKQFYHGLEAALQFEETAMEYYTYGV